jgi:hypothetical protein
LAMMYPKPKRVNDESFREYSLNCEICGGEPHDNHHYFSKGAGGPNHRLNKLTLCRICHTKCHSGKISRWQQLEIIAKREGLDPVEVEAALYRMRRGDLE